MARGDGVPRDVEVGETRVESWCSLQCSILEEVMVACCMNRSICREYHRAAENLKNKLFLC